MLARDKFNEIFYPTEEKVFIINQIIYVNNMRKLIGKESGDVAIVVNDYLIIINEVKYHYNNINGILKLTPIEFF